jgi:Cys-tRNA(Pro)/Cys-tRNA(Cys) deacylase
MAKKQRAGGTPATAALTKAGVRFTVHAYDHDDTVTSYGEEAATALGIDPRRVCKTLVVDTGPGRPGLAVAVVPVAGRLDLKAMAHAVGAKRVDLAEPRAAARSTGYVVGGISPLGQKTILPTVIDASVRDFPTILVSGGRRGLDVELAPDDLARLTSAIFAPIAAG